MVQRRPQINLSTYLNLTIGAIFAIAAVIVVFFVNSHMRQQALVEAESKARILLDRTLATHDYFSDQLKPQIFALSERQKDSEYFDPVWMSSTYANRMIDQYFGEKNEHNYYFKNCAINARSPENEANEYEKAFIQELVDASKTKPASMVRAMSLSYGFFMDFPVEATKTYARQVKDEWQRAQLDQTHPSVIRMCDEVIRYRPYIQVRAS